jgi:FMN phosphatase YigB (HAD superfamily)
MKPKIVIFDLDGTLALIDKRRALADKGNGKVNWKVFFSPDNIQLD